MERRQLLRLSIIRTYFDIIRSMAARERDHGRQAVEGHALLYVERLVAWDVSNTSDSRYIKTSFRITSCTRQSILRYAYLWH